MTEDIIKQPLTSSSNSTKLVNHACKTSRDLKGTSICSKHVQMLGFVDTFTGQNLNFNNCRLIE
jgi:hypothetical protein